MGEERPAAAALMASPSLASDGHHGSAALRTRPRPIMRPGDIFASHGVKATASVLQTVLGSMCSRVPSVTSMRLPPPLVGDGTIPLIRRRSVPSAVRADAWRPCVPFAPQRQESQQSSHSIWMQSATHLS